MKTLLTLMASALLAGASGKPLVVEGGAAHLVAPGDRFIVRYTVYEGSKAVRGTLFVRNDRQRAFTRLPLTHANGYQARVPARLIRGHKLLYHAVFRDPRGRRSLTVGPGVAWVMTRPVVVRLGTHRFGETRPPVEVVAHAPASAVGWRDPPPGEGPKAGPQTFLIHRDGSTWLDDEVNGRLLVWPAGQPDATPSRVPMPLGSEGSDLSFGPGGSLYATHVAGTGLATHIVLDRLALSGQRVWEAPLGGYYDPNARVFALGVNSPVRAGPGGILYCLAFMSSDEWGWMPVVTPGGRPIAPAAQRRRTHWPFQPVTGGLRLLGPEVYTPHDDMAAHEVRYALLNGHGSVVRSWRVLSGTELNFHGTVPDLVGGDPVIVLDFASGAREEYEVVRLGSHGARSSFSLPRMLWGDTALPDLRIGPAGDLFQLSTSPADGVTIYRYAGSP